MSRFDAVGLWWSDYKSDNKARTPASARVVRAVVPPDTGWLPPRDFPNLSAARILSLDVESKDLTLREKGPGFVKGQAHTVGFSLATQDAAWYFPYAHEYEAQKGLNLDKAQCLAWLNEQLQGNPRPIVGANLMYDLEALRSEGVALPGGELFDVQYAEPLIDEMAHSYALDVLAIKYLGEGKRTEQLYEWAAQCFGGNATAKDQAINIWRSPPTLVGPYAERDAEAPLRILQQQQKVLADEGMTELFRLECGLIPLLLEMRFRGVPIDLEKAQLTGKWLREEQAKAQAHLGDVDVWSNDSVARAFDKAGIEYTRTEAGNPSFTKLWLEACPADLAKAVLDVRLYEKAANPFVESYILGNQVNGRLHCQFHPLRSDEFGTVSGRFSSSNPNLQNIPVRHKVIGPMLRGLFVPEKGRRWRRTDYSQIEYRLLAHYAVGDMAEEIRERYRNEPKTSFHIMVAEMVKEVTGVMMEYKPAKNLNFGLVYGMGKDKTARSLGVDYELGLKLYNAYFEALPCVKQTYDSAQRLAERRGYIKTLLGRRSRFDTYEENPYRAGQMQRAGARKALNRCLQGGAADFMKKAMKDCWDAGLFKGDGCPHLTVHDELNWSDDGDVERFRQIEEIMINCLKLKVPMMIETETGSDWGHCSKL